MPNPQADLGVKVWTCEGVNVRASTFRFIASERANLRRRPAATGYSSGTKARPLFGFIGITSWFAPAS